MMLWLLKEKNVPPEFWALIKQSSDFDLVQNECYTLQIISVKGSFLCGLESLSKYSQVNITIEDKIMIIYDHTTAQVNIDLCKSDFRVFGGAHIKGSEKVKIV